MINVSKSLYFVIILFVLLSVSILFILSDSELLPIQVYGQTMLPPAFTEEQAKEGERLLTNNFTFPQTVIPSSTETSRMTEQSDQIGILTQNITYLDPINKFIIQYPTDWTPEIGGLADYADRVTFYSPLQNLDDLFPPQITVSMIIYEQNISLTEYSKQYIANLNQSSDIQVVGTNQYVLDGNPANITVYSSFSPFIGNGTRFDNLAAWTVIDGSKVFLVTYSAEATKYRTFLPLAIEAINSFRSF